MRKFYSFMLRFLPVLCIVCLVVSMAAPASAATQTYDYEDYVTNTVVANDGKVFTVSFPTENARWRIWDGYDFSGTLVFNEAGSSVVFLSAIVAKDYSMAVDPVGTSGYILCNNIPAGTKVKWVFDVSAYFSYTNPTVQIQMLYYDSSFKQLSHDTVSVGSSTLSEQFEVLCELNVPDQARYVRFQMHFLNFVVGHSDGESTTRDLRFDLNYFGMVFKVDSYYLMVQQQGKNTELLQEVNKQLEDQGQTMYEILGAQEDTNEKLDDMLNHDPTPEEPDGSGKVDDMGAIEGEINDEISDGLDEFGGVIDIGIFHIKYYSETFLAVAAIFNMFSEISLIKTLLILSLCIGFLSVLLNLGTLALGRDIVRGASRDARRSKKN